MEGFSIIDVKNKSRVWIEKIQKLLNTNFDRAFGLDIADGSIEIAELSKMFRFSIENHGRAELPEGIIKDGYVLDEKVLADQIKLLLQNVKPRLVSTNKVFISLPQSQVFTHHLVMNTMLTGAGLRLMVQKEITKVLPISPTRMYWDLKTKTIAGGGLSIVFIGIQKNVAESYVRVCNTVGLDVVGIGLEPLSIARLILTPTNSITAIINIGTHTTDVSVVKGNNDLNMTITIPIGGSEMTKVIAQGLNVDDKVAESKKIAVGSNNSEEIFFLIEPIVKNIAAEVKRIIAYFEKTFGENIDAILVVGGASITGGVKEKISEMLGKPVIPATHFNNFEDLDVLGGKNIVPTLYTSVVGLAMLGASNEFENINILKQIPSLQLSGMKKSDLLKSGYLSKTTAIRIMLNSRLMLVISSLLCVGSFLTFGYLWMSYNNMNPSYQIKEYKTVNITAKALSGSMNSILASLNNNIASSSNSTSTKASSTPQSVLKKVK
ncbi:MAG: pilus assembly protein PilM [Candidatus Taylorbacteria bacterium]